MFTHPLKSTKPTIKKKNFLQRLKPINLEEEKQKFLFDPSYNPQFEYEDPVKAEELLNYHSVSDDYLTLAYNILDHVKKEYRNEQDFIKSQSGKKISQEETLETINNFISDNKVQSYIEVKLSSKYNSRTSLKRQDQFFTLQIRLPITYREKNIYGMLYHEIGTHLFRWINEFKQPWYLKRNEYGLSSSFTQTEEGIASVHGQLPRNNYLLWAPAILYVASYEASQHSFNDLNKILKPYISDPNLRWKYCYRAKRGVKDTSTNLAFTKSQTYLKGTIKTLSWLINNNYAIEKLYTGKISLSDLDTANKIAINKQLILPHFIQDKKSYKQKINELIAINKLKKHL